MVLLSVRRSITLIAAACLLAGALVAAQAAARSSVIRVIVKIGDTSITVSRKTVPAGTVSFTVENVGKRSHTFSVGGKTTPVLKPKKSATLVVHFTTAKKYTFRVTLYRGRSGTISVTKPAATSGSSAELTAGKTVFKANCGTCHTLKQAGTTGTVGPNLDTLKPALSTIVSQVENGGRFMPAFGASAGGSLSSTQVKDVSAFVYAAEH